MWGLQENVLGCGGGRGDVGKGMREGVGKCVGVWGR